MSHILVISGHPDLSQSHTNQTILSRLGQARSDVSVRDLATLYPDSRIDVAAEQAALLATEVVVLQFPFYWYSVPGILKQWMDSVLTYGFAYGSTGDKLKGKKLIVSTTVGGPEESYRPEGYNQYTIDQLLMPLHQTATLAQMDWQTPAVSHGMVYIPGVYNTQELVESRANAHADALLAQLEALSPAEHAPIRALAADWFARMDALPESGAEFLAMLSEQLVIEVPEGRFEGHAGFTTWYQNLRAQFQPGCQHRLGKLMIEPVGDNRAELLFTVALSAQTLSGEPVEVEAREHWTLELDEGQVRIRHYRVTLD
ncbi:NAD(P)H-dependent oxidoreductase [Ferrimonas balearica]|uniref:NAD(P)H-dependent oxidoreductase n=1 Tax=Ferrimonas balearica TaxID=44012 RepID=UPI001C992A7C|nr:NAD(P)H-dependent oxidoreductase [Ferrimonas balearica]MBY5991316.1 NAD(P)H-dependent oxidoreductase [Ferrimonas balearica]